MRINEFLRYLQDCFFLWILQQINDEIYSKNIIVRLRHQFCKPLTLNQLCRLDLEVIFQHGCDSFTPYPLRIRLGQYILDEIARHISNDARMQYISPKFLEGPH
jgi:hypothetical protein